MRGIFHTFFLEQEAQFQTPAMQRVPGSSPDTCGHVWILSRVRSESSSCSTAHHSSQPPTTSALTHSYKFLLLFYISITFLGQLHSLNLRAFISLYECAVHCMCAIAPSLWLESWHCLRQLGHLYLELSRGKSTLGWLRAGTGGSTRIPEGSWRMWPFWRRWIPAGHRYLESEL